MKKLFIVSLLLLNACKQDNIEKVVETKTVTFPAEQQDAMSQIVNEKNKSKNFSTLSACQDTAAYLLTIACYRCLLGRNDLVNEIDCRKYGYSWKVKKIKDIKKTCH